MMVGRSELVVKMLNGRLTQPLATSKCKRAASTSTRTSGMLHNLTTGEAGRRKGVIISQINSAYPRILLTLLMGAGSGWKRSSIGYAWPHNMVKSCPRASSYHYCSRILSQCIFDEQACHDMQKCTLCALFKDKRALYHHHNSPRITLHMIVQLDSDFTDRLMYGMT
jgi:hypothetical protein